jgi:hypothetical protein
MGKRLSTSAQVRLESIARMQDALRSLRSDLETGALGAPGPELVVCRRFFQEVGIPLEKAIDGAYEAVHRWVLNEKTEDELLAALTKPTDLFGDAFDRLWDSESETSARMSERT